MKRRCQKSLCYFFSRAADYTGQRLWIPGCCGLAGLESSCSAAWGNHRQEKMRCEATCSSKIFQANQATKKWSYNLLQQIKRLSFIVGLSIQKLCWNMWTLMFFSQPSGNQVRTFSQTAAYYFLIAFIVHVHLPAPGSSYLLQLSLCSDDFLLAAN